MQISQLPHLLDNPTLVNEISESQWNVIIKHARQAELLGQLRARLEATKLFEERPSGVRRALELANRTANRRIEAAIWEVSNLRKSIPKHIPIVLLKGCAYALSKDENYLGRIFSDMDILVPHEHIRQVEDELVIVGWKPSEIDAYDQKYYREWMHELPPMEHMRRRTTLDIHHRIVPRISRYAFDPAILFDTAIEITPGIFVLDPANKIIHSALHAFLEGVPSKALRDLYDIRCLLIQYFPSKDDRKKMLARAKQLGLQSILQAALEASAIVYAGERLSSVENNEPSLRARCLAIAALSALSPSSFQGKVMAQILLAHSHWMKMPLYRLIPHLVRKSLINLFQREATT